jgi:hypothetical protein
MSMQDPRLALHLPMRGAADAGGGTCFKNDWSPLHYGFGLDKSLGNLLQCLRPDEAAAAAERNYHQRRENFVNGGDEWEETAQLFRPSVAAQDYSNDFVEWGWSTDKTSTVCLSPCGSPLDVGILDDLSNRYASNNTYRNMEISEGSNGVENVDRFCTPYANYESDFKGDAENNEAIEFDSSKFDNILIKTGGNNGILTPKKLPQNYLQISSNSTSLSALPSKSAKCRPLLPVSRVQLLIKGALRPPPSDSILRLLIRFNRTKQNTSSILLKVITPASGL